MIKQGSKQWFDERVGKITASRFSDVMANSKTKRFKNYQLEIINGLAGAPAMSETAPWYTHGKELEPIARDYYDFTMSLQNQPAVEEVGSIIHPKYEFISASPDGLVKSLNKGVEIKSSISHAAYLKNAKDKMPGKFRHQVQGQLWVCNFSSVDFVCFFSDPDGIMSDEINIVNVLPDFEYHKKLEERCLKFWAEVQEMMNQYEYIEGE